MAYHAPGPDVIQLPVREVFRDAESYAATQAHELAAEEPAEWHRAVAPGVKVCEIATHGLALSRLKHGFESRWGHHFDFVDV